MIWFASWAWTEANFLPLPIEIRTASWPATRAVLLKSESARSSRQLWISVVYGCLSSQPPPVAAPVGSIDMSVDRLAKGCKKNRNPGPLRTGDARLRTSRGSKKSPRNPERRICPNCRTRPEKIGSNPCAVMAFAPVNPSAKFANCDIVPVEVSRPRVKSGPRISHRAVC